MSLATRIADDVDAAVEAFLARRRARGFDARRLDLRACTTREAALDALAEAMAFPPYFGRNLDAADECLRDLGWLPESPRALAIVALDRLAHHAPKAARALEDVLEDAVDHWRGTASPLDVVRFESTTRLPSA